MPLSPKQNRQYLVCEVVDTGKYLDPRDCIAIFKPPNQKSSPLEEAYEKKFNLCNIKIITKALKARLHVDSNKDYGTSFVLIVPIKTQQGAHSLDPPETSTIPSTSQSIFT